MYFPFKSKWVIHQRDGSAYRLTIHTAWKMRISKPNLPGLRIYAIELSVSRVNHGSSQLADLCKHLFYTLSFTVFCYNIYNYYLMINAIELLTAMYIVYFIIKKSWCCRYNIRHSTIILPTFVFFLIFVATLIFLANIMKFLI